MANIVVINFFPAFTPPSSGGEMRLRSLYAALSEHHDIILVTSTDFGARFEQIGHTPRLREDRFPKNEHWREAYASLERSGVSGDLAGLAFAVAVSEPTCALRIHARELAASADLVIHEFPFSEPIFADGCPCREIYNSHNFEASLLSSIVSGPGFERSLLRLLRLEGNLVARAERVFATSDSDAEKFRLFYGAHRDQISLCPNGVDEPELAPVVASRRQRVRPLGQPATLLFLGSAHHPNVEAARWLVELAAEFPDCRLVLAGGLCGAISADVLLPPNLVLAGPLDAAAKRRLLGEADLFLNPVVLGSGTSLKALEALGSGIPMVSTPEGVRGLGLTAGVDCEIVPRSGFAATIRGLLSDAARSAAVAAAGFATASGHFSWQRIAQVLAQDLATRVSPWVSAVAAERPLVLALNNYPVLESGSGGIARVRNLLMHLDADVVVVAFGSTCDIALLAPGMLHVTVAKSAAHQAFEDAVNQGQAMSADDAIASLFVGSNQSLVEVVASLAARAHAVVFEHPYMAPILDHILAVQPQIPVIYSAHNVEATHKAEILRGHRIAATLTAFVGELERRLVASSGLVVCCTKADAEHFQAEGVRTIVVPNGCWIPDDAALLSARAERAHDSVPRIGFLGSSHGPNIEAAEFIAQELAEVFPHAHFEMIGSVCQAMSEPLPRNVVLHGTVSESQKTALMVQWDLALNPVESGGGSSLKLPDYVAHGLFTLNTPAGSRGFDVERHHIGRVVDRTQFRSELGKLIDAREVLANRRAAVRKHAVNKLGWQIITAEYRAMLRTLAQRPKPMAGHRVLVVTYRYTEPTLGGAEEYLVEVLKRLRPRFERLDLAAVDLEQITNAHHFGCRVTVPSGGASRRLGELFDRALFFAPDQLTEAETLDRSRRLERSWTAEERGLLSRIAPHLVKADRLRLFAGFYSPENHEGIVRRWTSPSFSLLLPPRAVSLRIAGFASRDKRLRLQLLKFGANAAAEVLATHHQPIAEHFDVTVSLPLAATADGPLLLACDVDEHLAAGDHRPFGVQLESACVSIDRARTTSGIEPLMSPLEISTTDLGEQIHEEFESERFDAWISALVASAQQRDPQMEEDFAAVRGPHSRALQAWIAENACDYDCVLVQGIPFDVIPSTAETLAQLPDRPRVVALPHFHGDDRFYHWKRYFKSFAAVDATLLFSSTIARLLGPCGEFAVVPGGGVRADEHGDPDSIAAFRAIYQSPRPFFLTLGRKTGSKRYEQIVRAHQEMRQTGVEVDLVMIGPDEDGRRIVGDDVHYLGIQPRDVVRGALSTCLGVITMSSSESFGIVICEAWLFKKPVIANRACYSFRELIRDGETGILATTDAELLHAMVQLAHQPDERERLGSNGFHDAITKFTWEQVAEACYRVIVPESHAKPAHAWESVTETATRDAAGMQSPRTLRSAMRRTATGRLKNLPR